MIAPALPPDEGLRAATPGRPEDLDDDALLAEITRHAKNFQTLTAARDVEREARDALSREARRRRLLLTDIAAAARVTDSYISRISRGAGRMFRHGHTPRP